MAEYFQDKARREAEEAAKKPRKPGQKRKGLGGLSPEKKRLLKVGLPHPFQEDDADLLSNAWMHSSSQ